MFDFFKRMVEKTMVNTSRISLEELIESEIKKFKASRQRAWMLAGERYYNGDHDILGRKRTVIGEKGELIEIENLPNNRLVDNQYKKMVDQKTNYLLSKPIVFHAENDAYTKKLKKIFNKKFKKLIIQVGEDGYNAGIGWVFIYYKNNELCFKRLKPWEVIAGWADDEHTTLDYLIRIYTTTLFEGTQEKTIEKVEYYDVSGIKYYEVTHGGRLKPCEPYFQSYFQVQDEDGVENYNWMKIPVVAFRNNAKEIPLIKGLKSLQDGINLIKSNFQNAMEEDSRNTILVLLNYDGQDLGQFRRNLAQYAAVKVKTVGDKAGDLKTLQIEVNSENYKVILEIFKKSIIENAMGYDAKDDRLAGNPNQMNIQSMYSDIDLDANKMETEYQASFEELMWFVNAHLSNEDGTDYEDEDLTVIFNRDILISESEVIANCQQSIGVISKETIVSMHPWVDDVQKELDRIQSEKQAEVDEYGSFGDHGHDHSHGDEVSDEEEEEI